MHNTGVDMYCTNCGKQIPDDSKFCTNCGANVSKPEMSQQPEQNFTAPRPFQPYSSIDPNQGIVNKTAFKGKQVSFGTSGSVSFNNGGKKGKKGLKIVLAIIAVLVVAVVAVLIFSNMGKGSLKLGQTSALMNFTVPTSGTTVTVTDPSSDLAGMNISVPSGSYSSNVDFDIETTDITSHSFGTNFNPVTPLISIDNSETTSKYPLTITIPIEKNPDEFAMAFYYDRKTQKLEAIPFESLTDTSITILTTHFSEFVVSTVQTSSLASRSVDIDTGFMPGQDDWPFVNYGSAIAPGGHCAGQSLTMAWYYHEKHIAAREPELNDRFDNNGNYLTESFWIDDSYGYRFASVIQNSINWTAPDFQNYINVSYTNPEDTYYAFVYAMVMTKEPQFVGVYSHDEYGNTTGGHALVAYKIENGRLYVADPNYPGQKDRYIGVQNNMLLPYSSGANAAEIENYGGTIYDHVSFVGKTALVDFNTIANNYQKVLNNTIGNDELPTIYVQYFSRLDSVEGAIWTDINDSITYDDNVGVPGEHKGYIMIIAGTGYDDVAYTLFKGTQYIEGPVYGTYNGNAYFEVDLEPGINDIGILAEVVMNGNYYYADFKRIEVDYVGNTVNTSTPTPTQSPSPSPSPSEIVNYTPEYMVGTYSYDSNNKEDEMTYIHVNCFIEIYSDGTMRDSGTWQGINEWSNQSSSHDYKETWSIVDNKLVSVNDSGFTRVWDINGDYISYDNGFGYTITYKKMN